MKVKILTHTPDPEKTIATAAKLCYSNSNVDALFESMSDEKTESFINMLLSLGHESPFEHASFTFAIEGVSRALLAQITRHRIASFSVQSQRYVDKGDFDFIVPPEIEDIPEAKELFLEEMEHDREVYKKLSEVLANHHYEVNISSGMEEKAAKNAASKKANEDARFVLANACDTKIIMTMNVRSLWNFFSLRCCNRAQWEIRELACEMLMLCRKVSPVLFAKAGPSCVSGPCKEGKMTCGKMAEVRKKLTVNS